MPEHEGTPDPVDRERALLGRLARGVAVVEDALLVLLVVAMIGFAGAQIVLRNLAHSGILWGDALLRVMVLWVGMAGAVVATRQDKQITVDVLPRLLPPRWRARLRVVTDLFTAGVCLFVGWHAGRLMLDDRAAGITAFASVPVWVCELVLPIGFGLIGVRYLIHAVSHLRRGLAGREAP